MPGQVIVLSAADGGTVVVDGGVAIVSGPPGTQPIKGWARVYFSGSLSAGWNVTSAMVSAASGNPGTVCFRNLPFVVQGAMASADATYGFPVNNQVIVSVHANAIASGCPGLGEQDFDHVAFLSGYSLNPVGPASFQSATVIFF